MKKYLLKEIMGVPKVLDPWIDSLKNIILEIIKDEESSGWEQRGEVTFEDPDTGEEITEDIYKSENIFFPGNEVMDMIMGEMGFSDMKEFINSKEFQDLPIWRPTLKVNIIAIPQKLLSQHDDTVSASVGLMPDQKFSNIGKVKVLPNMDLEFTVTIEKEGISSKDISELEEAISHELLHAYQKVNQLKGGGESHFGPETALNALSNNPHFNSINIEWWSKFLHLIYLHLSFEINARVTQLYYRLKNKDIKTTEDFVRELEKSGVWRQMKMLENFNAEEFINEFELPSRLSRIIDIMGDDEEFSNPLAFLHNLFKDSHYKSMGVDISSKEEAIKSLINLWDEILTMGVGAMNKMGTNLTMDKVPQKAKEDPYVFFKFFENRFHKKAETWKRKMYKVGSLILQEKGDSSLQSEKQ
jgi:hypothetical protein